MQMTLKSGEIRGHPCLLELISNKCNIVYIIHEISLYADYTFWPWAPFFYIQRRKELSLHRSTVLCHINGHMMWHSGQQYFFFGESLFRNTILTSITHKRSIHLLISYGYSLPINQARKAAKQQGRATPSREVVRRIASKIATPLLRASKWHILSLHKKGCIKIKMLKSNYYRAIK